MSGLARGPTLSGCQIVRNAGVADGLVVGGMGVSEVARGLEVPRVGISVLGV